MNDLAMAGERVKAGRDRMEALKRGIAQELDLVEPPIKHYFGDGVYGREMFIKKGVVVVGKIHKYRTINILSQGHLLMHVEGVQPAQIKAPFTVVGEPGTQRAVYALEDSIWTCFHGTDETDLEKIEAKFIAQDADEFLEFVEVQKAIEGVAL